MFVETIARAADAKERKNLGKMSQAKAVDRLMGMTEYVRSEVADIYLAYGRREGSKREIIRDANQIKRNRLTTDQLAARLAGQLGLRS
jgi:hypothetical protein